MNCILIETSAYADLQAHVQRLLERVSALQVLTEKSPTVRWLTADDEGFEYYQTSVAILSVLRYHTLHSHWKQSRIPGRGCPLSSGKEPDKS